MAGDGEGGGMGGGGGGLEMAAMMRGMSASGTASHVSARGRSGSRATVAACFCRNSHCCGVWCAAAAAAALDASASTDSRVVMGACGVGACGVAGCEKERVREPYAGAEARAELRQPAALLHGWHGRSPLAPVGCYC